MAKRIGYTHNRNWQFTNDTTDTSRAAAYENWKDNDMPTGTKREEPETEFGPVSSSWLTALGYNANTEEALATFKGTNEIFYYPMDYQTYLLWRASPSKGKWLHEFLSGGHFYRKESGFKGKAQSDRTLQRIANRQLETGRNQGELSGTYLRGRNKKDAARVYKNYMGDESALEGIRVNKKGRTVPQSLPMANLPDPEIYISRVPRQNRYAAEVGKARKNDKYR